MPGQGSHLTQALRTQLPGGIRIDLSRLSSGFAVILVRDRSLSVEDMKLLVIVASLGSLTVGTSFPTSRFPLHVTLVPPFHVDCELTTLIAVVKVVARKTGRVLAEVIGQEQFGPDADIPVALIRPIESVLNAHSRLTEALRPLGWAAKEPHYNGEGFRRHITATDDRHVSLGEQFLLNQIAVIEMLDLPTVRATYRLSDFLTKG